jgi:uncharacterized protein (TIGR02246 family)
MIMAFEGTIADRLAIRELFDSYADAVCVVDAAAWGDTWAEDGVWELPDYPELGRIVGRSNIVTAWVAAMAHYPGIIFTATPGAIVVTGDRATARCWTSEVYDQHGTTKRDRGRYDDVLVKRGGRWLFESRVFRNVHRQ